MADMHAAFSRAGSRDESLFVAEMRGHSELAVVCDLAALSDEAWRGICSRVFESLSRQGQVGRMACSGGHTDVPGLPSRAAFLSQCLEEYVCLDAPTFLWVDSILSGQGAGVMREELARFREEAALMAGARSVEEFRAQLEDFVRSWRSRNLPLVAVRKLLGLLVDAVEECTNDPSPTRENRVAVEELLARCGGYEALVQELCLVYEAANERRRDADSSSEGIVQAAIELFRCNLSRNLTMREVAMRLGFSLSYTHRVLRSALGKAPMEYYNDMKLEEAKRLLARYPHRKVKEIALSLGFENQHYFSRVFRTHASLSPREYRQQARGAP
jgi:AraC-like DNA-binding protein